MSTWRKLVNTIRRRRLDAAIDEELDFHRAMAAHDAGRSLGNNIYWKEETRSMNLWMWLETLGQDLRFGVRELIRNRGFATTAILSLGLGIMAATAVYSVLYGVVLEPFPYKDVDNLINIILRDPENNRGRFGFTVDEYAEIAARSRVLEGVAASTISDVLWIDKGEPQRLRGNHISHNGFDVMGVPAMLGRAVTAKEEEPETKAVLSYRYWANRFASDPGVIGQTMILNNRPRTIIGVMPPRFMFRGPDVYLPIQFRVGQQAEDVQFVAITARRRPGTTDARIRTDLDPIFRDLALRFPDRYPRTWRVDAPTFKETFPSSIGGVLWIMFGAVGMLLLIACANVSSLLLARAANRQKEIAMRAALGAGRYRLIRQLLTESLLLGIAGAALGIAASWAGLKAIMAIVPPGVIPDESEVVLNWPVLGFSLVLCLAATFLFGLAPALHATVADLANPIKESARSTGSRRSGWLRSGLVVVELSLAIILLAGAGLFLHTLVRVYTADLGVGIENRLTFRLPVSTQRYPTPQRRAAFIDQVLEKIQSVPGVLGAGINSGIHPLYSWSFQVTIPGAATADQRRVNFHQVNAGYWKLTGIGLRAGRLLETTDISARRQLAVVNEAFTRRYFANQPPLGKFVQIPQLRQAPASLASDQFEIVGVVADALRDLQTSEPRPEMYVPYSVLAMADSIVVHTAGDPMQLSQAIRKQIYSLDGSQFVDQVFALSSLMDREIYSGRRFQLWLMGVFAVLGLTLSVIGIYGLLAQIVSQQRQEFGVRMAVGASFADILRIVLLRGAKVIALGLAIGLISAYGLLRYLGAKLGVPDAIDPPSLTGACIVLALAGLVACLIPAIRAGRLDPVQALRSE